MATEGHKPTDYLLTRDAAVLPGTSCVLSKWKEKEGACCLGFGFLLGNRELFLSNSSPLLSPYPDSRCTHYLCSQLQLHWYLFVFLTLLTENAFAVSEFFSQPEAPSP